MRSIAKVGFDVVQDEWRRADQGRSGGSTLGLLGPFFELEWWRVEVDWQNLSTVLTIHSNKRNGETNQWEFLSSGTYRFPDIADAVLRGESGTAAGKVRRYAENVVTWRCRPIFVTDSIENGLIMCVDGCNRLAAAFLRRAQNLAQPIPETLVGQGETAKPETLNQVFGFELGRRKSP